MMNYYEELGVAPSASCDEIRQAYKQLARLIHPDHCGDAELRGLADLQMKRLNGVLEILSDITLRANYDRLLNGGGVKVMDRARWQAALWDPRWRWPAAGVAALLAMLLLAATLPRKTQRQAWARVPFETEAKPFPPLQVNRLPALHAKPSARTEGEEDQGEAESRLARETAGRAAAQITRETPAWVEAPALPQNAEQITENRALPLDSGAGQIPHTLAGNWLFVQSPSVRSAGYRPEYIELRLTEDSGILRGRYQARYRVTDRAISPNVAFEFVGRAGPDGGSLPWKGPGNATGEVTLRLLTSGILEVTWVAHQLGENLGLISGTAVLIRKLE